MLDEFSTAAGSIAGAFAIALVLWAYWKDRGSTAMPARSAIALILLGTPVLVTVASASVIQFMHYSGDSSHAPTSVSIAFGLLFYPALVFYYSLGGIVWVAAALYAICRWYQLGMNSRARISILIVFGLPVILLSAHLVWWYATGPHLLGRWTLLDSHFALVVGFAA